MRIQQVLAGTPFLLIVFALYGCGGDSVTSLSSELMMLEHVDGADARSELPLRGTCETTFNPPPFPPPPVHEQTDEGTCTLSHLGRSHFYSVKQIDFIAGTQTTTEAIFTAANGDALRAVGSGTSQPLGNGRVRFTATLTFTGGTGRFARAEGEAFVEGEASALTATASLDIVGGWIHYRASDRRN